MKDFNKYNFWLATGYFLFILIVSFVFAFAADDGNLGNNIVSIILSKLFFILGFPFHTLFGEILIEFSPAVYLFGLLINCMLYGLITERGISFFNQWKARRGKV